MTVVGDGGLPHEAGRRDAAHHRDRVKRKIVEQLKRRVGEEDIVAAGPEKRISVPVKGTKQWRFIHDRGQKGQGVGQGDAKPGDVLGPPGDGQGQGQAGTEPGEETYEVVLDMQDVEEMLFAELGLPRLKPKAHADISDVDVTYDTIARKGPQIDKKATLMANIARNARAGRARLGGIDKADLRYLSYRERPRPRHKAVVMMLMDQSWSMDTDRKRIARLFFYWCVAFLRRRYDQCDLVFVGHTTEAYELDEHEFFSRVQSGGTKVSSAFEKAIELQKLRYPPADWNVYVLHASDGDNYADDNARTVELIRQLAGDAALVGYLEIDPRAGNPFSGAYREHKLSNYYQAHATDIDGFVTATARDDRALWPALKRFFAKDQVEEATR